MASHKPLILTPTGVRELPAGDTLGASDAGAPGPTDFPRLAYILALLGSLSSNSLPAATTAYTLVLSDAGLCVETTTSSAITVTVPVSTSVSFPVGTVIEVLQYGTGQVTIAAASGVTLRSSSSLTTRAQYSSVALRMRVTDEWVVSGDLT